MKDEKKTSSKIELGALFYPVKVDDKDVPFESLYLPHIWKEIYFEGIYNDMFNQREGMIIIDVGANSGLVTQYMRDYAKKLYAIEPSSIHFEALKKNKEYNKWDNVEVFNAAIADKDGEMELILNEGNQTMHSLAFGKVAEKGGAGYTVQSTKDAPYTDSEKVKTIAFDTFFKDNKIDEVDFIKFDVEGAEDLILRSEGFKKVAPKIKAIMVEFHFPTWPELVKHMIKLGFEARRYDSSAIIVLFTRS